MFIELNLDDIVVVENLTQIKLFKSIDKVASHYKVPYDLVKKNIEYNELCKITGRDGRQSLDSKKTNTSIVCMNLQTMLRI